MIAAYTKSKFVKPVLKWAGGKRAILTEIISRKPKKIECYFEPFLGGGAVFFELQPDNYVCSDINSELVNVYYQIKNNLPSLIKELSTYENNEDFYYRIRELDREPLMYSVLPDVKKAARIIFLNKTCFNGLFRVNSQGQFNVPFGAYSNPNFCDKTTLEALSRYLNSSKGTIIHSDFEATINKAQEGDFIYLDPPYDPISSTSSFTGYALDGFPKTEQIRLKVAIHAASNRGVKFLLSNSSTDFIRELYAEYKIEDINAPRSIGANKASRGTVGEVLISNY